MWEPAVKYQLFLDKNTWQLLREDQELKHLNLNTLFDGTI